MRKTSAILLVGIIASLVFAQLDGFPVNLGMGSLSLWGAPAIAQMDSNAFVLIGSTAESLYAVDMDGSFAPGFPVAMPGPVRAKIAWEQTETGIAIFAITTNGYLCRTDWNGLSTISVFSYSLGENANYISPVITDAEGDGELEVYAAIDTTLFCYSFDGDFFWSAEFYSSATAMAVATPAAGDIDGDGEDEIIIEGYDALFAFNSDGSPVDSFPLQLDDDEAFSYSAPFLWDYDNDGLMEIFCGAHQISGAEFGMIYAVDVETPELTTPIYILGADYGTWIYSPAALGDANGDYLYDITIGSVDGYIWAITGDGAVASFGGAILHMNDTLGHIYGSCILCDIDGKAGAEYILQMVHEDGNTAYLVAMDPAANYMDSLYAVDDTSIAGLPDSMYQENSGIITPAVFSRAGSTYIATATGDGALYIWGIPNTPLPGYAHWLELFGDHRNRSLAPPNAPAIKCTQQSDSQYVISWSVCENTEFAAYMLYSCPDSAGTTDVELLTRIAESAETTFAYYSSAEPESIWFFVVVEDRMGRTSLRSVPVSGADTTYIAFVRQIPVIASINISPSPFNAACRINAPGAKYIEVMSIDGKMLRVLSVSGDMAMLRSEGLPSGVIMICARDSMGNLIATEKAVLLR